MIRELNDSEMEMVAGGFDLLPLPVWGAPVYNGPVFNGAFNPQAQNTGTINGGGSGQTGQQIFNF